MVGRLSSIGGTCLSLASWPAFLGFASVQSEQNGRGVNGFGSFYPNKRTSAAGPTPGTCSFLLLTKRKFIIGMKITKNSRPATSRKLLHQTDHSRSHDRYLLLIVNPGMTLTIGSCGLHALFACMQDGEADDRFALIMDDHLVIGELTFRGITRLLKIDIQGVGFLVIVDLHRVLRRLI